MRMNGAKFDLLVRIPYCKFRQKDCSSFFRRTVLFGKDNVVKSYQSAIRSPLSCIDMLFPLFGKYFRCFPIGIKWTAQQCEDLNKTVC